MASVRVAPRRSGVNAIRRGSAFVSPVVSSDSDTSDGELETQDSPPRRQSRWSRESSSSSSESSETFSVDEDDVHDLEAMTDAYEDFVSRRVSPLQRKRSSQTSSQPSVAKLDRLRRIFLNMPAKPAKSPRKEKLKDSKRHQQPQKTGKKSNSHSSSSFEGTNSNSSGDEKERDMAGTRVGQTPPLTLPIDHHVKTLSEQVKRLARTHNAHAQQWNAMLTQAIAELQFVKQQEERALQSHVQLLQESYALRLEVFEQQYRAKVAEIRDQLQQEIAQHRQHSDLVIVTTAQRLQEQAQQVLLQTDGCGNQEDSKTSDDATMTLVKTNQFLQRQQQREDARRSRLQPPVKVESESLASSGLLSPVSKQRAKLKMLEQKLALFPRETVERVSRAMDNQYRERRSRGDNTSAVATVLATAHSPPSPRRSGEDGLQPTPLSPLRKRTSYWHNGISREAPSDRQSGTEASRPQQRPTSALSRRFLRPDEEKELRMLRNSIGLAKDWMEQHNSHAPG